MEEHQKETNRLLVISQTASCSGDGKKNKDDLYLFTRAQVFKKSTSWSSAPSRSLTFPIPTPGVMKSPHRSFTHYSDSGFETPSLILSFPGLHDTFSSYQNHGDSRGYHSSLSTPAMPPVLMPSSLDMFSLKNADQLPIFDAATDGAGSASWLQLFGDSTGRIVYQVRPVKDWLRPAFVFYLHSSRLSAVVKLFILLCVRPLPYQRHPSNEFPHNFSPLVVFFLCRFLPRLSPPGLLKHPTILLEN